MKTLLTLLHGEMKVGNRPFRSIAVGALYALGLFVVILQLRSVL